MNVLQHGWWMQAKCFIWRSGKERGSVPRWEEKLIRETDSAGFNVVGSEGIFQVDYIIWSSHGKFGTEPRVNWGSAKTLMLLDALHMVGTQIFIDYRKDAFMSLLVGDYWDDTAFQDTLPPSRRRRRIMSIAMAIALLTDTTYVILRMTPKDRGY